MKKQILLTIFSILLNFNLDAGNTNHILTNNARCNNTFSDYYEECSLSQDGNDNINIEL